MRYGTVAAWIATRGEHIDRKHDLIPVDRTTLERELLRAGARYYIDTIRRFSGKNSIG